MVLKSEKTAPYEEENQSRKALELRDKEYAWEEFKIDYEKAARGTNRFAGFIESDLDKQTQILTFVLWALKWKLEPGTDLKQFIGELLNNLALPEYKHIKAWVYGNTTTPALHVDEIVAFINSLSYSDFLELREISQDVFGWMKSYATWRDLVRSFKHPAFSAKEEFSMLVNDPACYHLPLDHQRNRKENWF
ncbi:MAG TPA: hypothetical protein PLW44_04785 [Chitinophagales bacterium]|nr:hypothetical protein [Chitinophagales bacterium]